MSLKALKLVKNRSSSNRDKDDCETRRTQNQEQLSQFLDGTQAVIFKLDTIKQYRRTGYIKHKPATSNGSKGKYTNDDIRCVRLWMSGMMRPVCGQANKNSVSELMVCLVSKNINA